MVPLFGVAYAAPNKDTTILYSFRSLKTNPVNGKIQGLFKAFDCFSSTFQGRFNFQGLSKTVLYIHVLFKPVQTLHYTSSLWDWNLLVESSSVLSYGAAQVIRLRFCEILSMLCKPNMNYYN